MKKWKRICGFVLACCILCTLLLRPVKAEEAFSATAAIHIQTGDDGKETEVTAQWDDEWFSASAATYNHTLALTALALSGAAYVTDETGAPSPQRVQDALGAFQFHHIQSFNYDYAHSKEDNDVAAYTFAARELTQTAGETLIAIVVKGTSGNEEWYSNFNVGTGAEHEGFRLAAEDLQNHLETYLTANGLSGKLKFLVTGHSRGAAVANLAAASLSASDWAAPENVFGYTFATPMVTTADTTYQNIFNIVNGEDFITRMPLAAWDYHRNGIDLQLPSRSSRGTDYSSLYDRMNKTFTALTGSAFVEYPDGTQAVDAVIEAAEELAPNVNDFYNKTYTIYTISNGLSKTTITTNEYFQLLADLLINGITLNSSSKLLTASSNANFAKLTQFFISNHVANSRIFSAHSIAGYYSWLSSCTADELFGSTAGSTERMFKRITVSGSADVCVYGQTGAVLAEISGEDVSTSSTSLAASVKSKTKTIDLPLNQEYTIKMTAADDGTVTYSIAALSASGTGKTVLWTVSFDGIKLMEGDELTGAVSGSMDTPAARYSLTKNDGTVFEPSSDSGTPKGYTVTAAEVEHGTVSAVPANVAAGETVTVTMVPDTGYHPDSLIAVDSIGKELTLTATGNNTYTFTAPASNVSLMAAFVKDTFTDVAWDSFCYDSVQWAAAEGIASGYADGSFQPDSTCTVAHILTFLWRAQGSPSSNAECPFPEVMPDSAFYPALCWAGEKGILLDGEAASYNAECTRALAVTFMWRASGCPAAAQSVAFSDVAQDAACAQAVAWAVSAGITTGYNDGTFRPDNVCTRGHIVTFLYRHGSQVSV